MESSSRNRRLNRIAAARSVAIKPKHVDRQMNFQPMVAELSVKDDVDSVMEILQEEKCESEIKQEEEEKNIMSLNDDCLLEVFEHFNMEDLCAIKDCCRRFSDLAIAVVKKGFRKKEYDEHLCLPSIPKYFDKDFAVKALMATKFGEFITHVEIVGCHKDVWHIGTVLKNCTSVKSLRFTNVSLGLVPVGKLKEMFMNIETLEVLFCRVSTRKIAGILKCTNALKHLFIRGKLPISSDLIAAIVDCENIESICLRITGNHDASGTEFHGHAKQLQQLKKLKCLEIFYVPYCFGIAPAMEILAKIGSLEELTLSWFIPDGNFFKSLDSFVNLKTFNIHTYKKIPEENLLAASKFTATEKTHIEQPRYTHTLVRKN